MEELKKTVFDKDFFRKLTFWGQVRFSENRRLRRAGAQALGALQGAQRFLVEKVRVLLIIFVRYFLFVFSRRWGINMEGFINMEAPIDGGPPKNLANGKGFANILCVIFLITFGGLLRSN